MKNINEQILEAMHLRLYRIRHENEFVAKIAEVYCVRPTGNSKAALFDMLTTIYEYGKIVGIRSERERRQKRPR